MLKTYDAVMQPNGYIGFREPTPPIFYEPTDIYITVRKPAHSSATQPVPATLAPARGNGATLLQWIKDNPMPAHMQKTAAEIDAQIQEMRNSWD
jgi:hypothetical protein